MGGETALQGLATRLEETLHERSGFVLEEPSVEANASGKELRSVKEVAELRFACPINNTLYPRPKEGTCTHRTGLDRHVERTSLEVLPPEGFGSRGDGKELGMSRRVAEALHTIVSPGDHSSSTDDDGADGDLSLLVGLLGLL
jgi:hypothetical protein